MQRFQPCPTDRDIIKRMKQSLLDADMTSRIQADFAKTFEQIGMVREKAEELANDILHIIPDSWSREDFEHKKHQFLTQARIAWGGNFLDAMAQSMQWRAELIWSQLNPYIEDSTFPLLDFGWGDGQVGQTIADKNRRMVEIFDIVPFPHPSVRLPVQAYDGKRIPRPDRHYHDSVATNVLHHEVDNDNCLKELQRLTQKRIILIETVPVWADTEGIKRDFWRTFMNDVMWNSILKKPGTKIPIPWAYRTPQKWEEALEKIGLKIIASEDLWVDQKTIQDTHHLLVGDF